MVRKKKKQGIDLRLHLALLLVFLAGLFFPRNFSFYESTPKLSKLIISDPVAPNSTFNIVAVTSDGLGVIGQVSVELEKGSGRVLLNTNPFVETDTQLSIETAKSVAEKASGFSLNEEDVIVTFSVDGDLVGGGSGGAATTAAIFSAITGKKLNSSVVVTGTINSDGTIGQIGGVLEKAQAAAEYGKELFLVPKGQSKIDYYEKTAIVSEVVGGAVLTRYAYTPKTLDISNYTWSQWGMRTVEVSSIQDVVSYALET